MKASEGGAAATGGSPGLIRLVMEANPDAAPTHEAIRRAVSDLIIAGSTNMNMARYVQECEPSGKHALLDWVGRDCVAYDKANQSHERLRALARELLPSVTA
jgi:hypothetical protein